MRDGQSQVSLHIISSPDSAVQPAHSCHASRIISYVPVYQSRRLDYNLPSFNSGVTPLSGDQLMRKYILLFLSFALLIGSLPARAQEPAAEVNAQIRKEAADHSQIMHTMHFLADVYGPRLTGSPNH